QRNDLFSLAPGVTSPGGTEAERNRLTTGLRGASPAGTNDGRGLAFTVQGKGTIYLEVADLTAEGKVENRRDLVPSARFEQAYTPVFSPDDRHVAYSVWTAGGY